MDSEEVKNPVNIMVKDTVKLPVQKMSRDNSIIYYKAIKKIKKD